MDWREFVPLFWNQSKSDRVMIKRLNGVWEIMDVLGCPRMDWSQIKSWHPGRVLTFPVLVIYLQRKTSTCGFPWNLAFLRFFPIFPVCLFFPGKTCTAFQNHLSSYLEKTPDRRNSSSNISHSILLK